MRALRSHRYSKLSCDSKRFKAKLQSQDFSSLFFTGSTSYSGSISAWNQISLSATFCPFFSPQRSSPAQHWSSSSTRSSIPSLSQTTDTTRFTSSVFSCDHGGCAMQSFRSMVSQHGCASAAWATPGSDLQQQQAETASPSDARLIRATKWDLGQQLLVPRCLS